MRCFMIAVAQGSTLDRYSNNFSLFLLLEQFRPAAYPARLSVFSHAFFEVDADENGVEHQVRLVVMRAGKQEFATEPVAFQPTGERHRVRISGLAFPEPGLYRVCVEWRVRADGDGGAWNQEAVGWPVRADVPLQ
ncbi:MAG TPA: hypothetical protein VGK20_16070 [Candidatus Binatia bacterium]|jgi:hypothetical protein